MGLKFDTAYALAASWTIFSIFVVLFITLILVVLSGKDRLSAKLMGWTAWFESNESIRLGLMYPQFPINVMNGLFAAVGPIMIVREWKLDVTLLGSLVFAEHAIQVFTQYPCGYYVQTDGHKAAQQRSVKILGLSAVMFALLPLQSPEWARSSQWTMFMWYLMARVVFAWGTNQFDANYNAAMNNSAFLRPHQVLPKAIGIILRLIAIPHQHQQQHLH